LLVQRSGLVPGVEQTATGARFGREIRNVTNQRKFNNLAARGGSARWATQQLADLLQLCSPT